jgi:phage shock protein E
MRNFLILFASAASFFLGACGSDVEESMDTPISAVEESAGTSISAAEEPAGSPISMAQLANRIQSGSPPLVLDIRARGEYARGHIPGAVNIPHDELPTRLTELPVAKSEEIVVAFGRGERAKSADETLRGSGYSNVRHLVGYWQEWPAAGLPTE